MKTRMNRSRGNTTLRILVNLALIGLAVVLYLKKDVFFHRQPKPVAVEPAATPKPRPHPTRTPRVQMPEPGEGVVDVAPELEPEPIPAATPAPTPEVPERVDLIALARQPREWPRHVTLLAATPFTLVMNRAAAGKMQVPAGSLVEVRKFNGQALELGFKGAIAVVPVAGTDFEARALAKRNATNLTTTPAPTPPLASVSTPAPTTALAETPTQMPEPRRLEIEVVRAKKTKDTGNYYNNKKEEISLRVKLRNVDLRLDFKELKGEIFVFTESSTARGVVKLAIREQFDITVPARGTFEHETKEIVTVYDSYDTIGGYKYDGWTLLIKDRTGAVIVKKSSSPTFLENLEAMDAMETGGTYPKGTWVRKGATQ